MKGILGINARNLSYITAVNPQKKILFIKDKFRTKDFLEQRSIPVPGTYHVFASSSDVLAWDMDAQILPCVIKPNKGSQGNGIMLVKEKLDIRSVESRQWWGKKKKKDEQFFKTSQGEKSLSEIQQHCISIIEGSYNDYGKKDHVLIEEILIPGGGFEPFCERGLADIRVICYNLVPVAAMVRVPTRDSHGTANLAQGGLGLGVDIVTGVIKTVAKKGGIVYTKKNCPDQYRGRIGKKLPFWSDILFLSSRIQFFVNMGYIGLDRVVTERGPMILELNGRAGLEIQNISQVPLDRVFTMINQLDVRSPRQGVDIAKILFHSSEQGVSEQLLYLSQDVIIKSADEEITAIAEVDVDKKKSYIHQDLRTYCRESTTYTLFIPHLKKEYTIMLHPSTALDRNTISFGTSFLKKFLIKPEHMYNITTRQIFPCIKKDEKELISILDKKVATYHTSLSLAKALFPLNYYDEMDTFVTKEGKYNPQFFYDFWPQKKLEKHYHHGLQLIQKIDDYHLTSEYAELLIQKINQTMQRNRFVVSLHHQDYETAMQIQRKLWGGVNKDSLRRAHEAVESASLPSAKDFGAVLSPTEVLKTVRMYLDDHGFGSVSIRKKYSDTSRISVGYTSKDVWINLGSSVKKPFRVKSLQAKLIHEIDVHLTRYMNGKKTGRSLLTIGTPGYRTTEEGLAIYCSEQYVRESFPDYRNTDIANIYLLLEQSDKLSYQDFAKYIDEGKNDLYSRRKRYAQLFSKIFRFKKGLVDGSTLGYSYLGDTVYWHGYCQIAQYVEQGGDIDDLMVGKIALKHQPLFDE